ncbi:transglycosylase SLT domain-containing protein [Streptomyces sp. NBC_00859]|uniref:transglycosylase SLT domain-containing protein n=1 Tax=Streptomyces sp. NBC_00859 TaxID=2903682 RepID=UPI003864ECD4|nr:transglycosylase SLT domain-containing protein [Streptomyces sp. NBC_00859]
MPASTHGATGRTASIRKASVTGIAVLGAAAAALSVAPSAHAAEPASHSASSSHVPAAAVSAQAHAATEKAGKAPSYPDNLDGWIRHSLAIMKAKGIPGSYDGLHRNIIRESGGNPQASNNWDINAQNGTPSKGLLQVIQPVFEQYHVAGTSHDLTDPVANITAAADYAAHKYGSIDNVDSAY